MPTTHASTAREHRRTNHSPATRTNKRGDGSIDAIRLLRNDHKEVEALFDQFERLRSAARKRMVADRICMLLEVHTQIEEEIFYPGVRHLLRLDDILDEAEVEHASAKDLIAQIRDDEPEDPLFDAKVKVLGEYIHHHVKEEHAELFPRVSASSIDTLALGKRMQARKDELLARYDER